MVTVDDLGGAGVDLLRCVLALGSAAMGGSPRAAVLGGLLALAAVFLVVRARRERSRASEVEGSGEGPRWCGWHGTNSCGAWPSPTVWPGS